MSDSPKDIQNDISDKISKSIDVFDAFTQFFSNSYHTFIVRKAERLASAIYVVTGFMPPDEPVRSRLRSLSLELISSSSRASELLRNEAERFESRCVEIATILETAQYAGLVSFMNAKMIGEEYGALASFVRTHAARISEPRNVLRKGSVSEPKSLSSSIRHSRKGLLETDSISKKTSKIHSDHSNTQRKGLILSLFNTKLSISLKDAVSVVIGVSEKTVQRELLDLVSQGVLIKEGKRRWTTYRLA